MPKRDDDATPEIEGFAPRALRNSKRFEPIRALGEGGMGRVYLVHDRELGTRVALKTLTRHNATNLYRFKKEFRSLANVSHENLVVLHELVCEDDAWFLIMEHVEGREFLSYLQRRDPREWDFDEDTVPLDKLIDGPGRPHISGVVPRLGAHGEPRVRDAFTQLALGVQALHDAGKLHKDLKPSNVLVTDAGRVVLLDFGMVDDSVRHATRVTLDDGVFGTPAYVAPEQAAGAEAGEAADWYSFGVMLYEALTGRLPIDGSVLDIITRKQLEPPRPPSELAANVPEGLERLCMQLLERNPLRRPTGASILAQLQPTTAPSPPKAAPRGTRRSGERDPFVGREDERRALRDAFDAAGEGHPVVALVQGPSGIGKSALVRHFVRALEAQADAVVLVGRCYERESVPFKAVDSLIDSLVRHLRNLPDAEAARLIPRNTPALSRLFPVLAQVPAIERAPARIAVRDPGEVRRRGFGALKELLGRIADDQPLVLCIDDLQWGDADSAALLSHVLAPPDPASMLILATHRDDVVGALEPFAGLPDLDLRRLQLGPLTQEEARALARSQLGSDGGDGARLAAIARESEGSPFFVGELVRSVLRRPAPQAGEASDSLRISLDQALGERIATLSDSARDLLRAIAVAGRPLAQGVALATAGLSPDDSTVWSALRSGSFVQTGGTGGDRAVDCFHQRVRDAVVGQLDAATLRDCHARLAHALEQAGAADPESLGFHYERAGDVTTAARHMLEAARAASAALAFGRAARLYRWLLGATSPDVQQRSRLEHALGDALASGARGAEAAQAYRRAREGAPRAQALELERLAAEYFLRSGHVKEGLESLERVLSAVGMRLPRSPAQALASLMLRRTRLRVRGLRFQERRVEEIPAELLIRLDTCWSASSGLGLVDFVRGGDFQTRHLLFALEAGDPFRVVRALAMEAGYLAADGTRSAARTAEVVALAREMAERIGEPHAQGLSMMADGMARWHLGKWREALSMCQQAEHTFRERCVGATWEIATSHVFQAAAQYWLGDLRTLANEGAEHLREALQNGDRFATSDLQTGYHIIPRLARGQVELTRAIVNEQKRQWPDEGFHLQHWNQIQADCLIDLYDGVGAHALTRLDDRWRALQRSLVMQVQVVSVEAQQLRANCVLAAALEQPREREPLLRRASSIARRLHRQGLSWTRGLALLIDGSVHELRGQVAEARAAFQGAVVSLDAHDMALHAACARYRLGRLIDGSGGEAQMARGMTFIAAQGAWRPERLIAALAPGF